MLPGPQYQQQQQQQQQQQIQSQHASSIPTPKKFSFNSGNMISVFSKNSNVTATTTANSMVPVYQSSPNENYQNGQQQQQQFHKQPSQRMIMRANNPHNILNHFDSSESTSSGRYICLLIL